MDTVAERIMNTKMVVVQHKVARIVTRHAIVVKRMQMAIVYMIAAILLILLFIQG